ncbi:MAG TPA: hypothetical protein VNK25_03440 [Candidatus Nitrosotenuis sp.]|jgi:hypothetical protein|nr:hypothetical protein [Candidatus Nitrosotenuis sp.]
MKINTTITILGVALAIVAGMFTANVSGLLGAKSTESGAQAAAMFTGHVETVVRDADGNIKEYRQSDNVITNTGENCALRLLFQLNPTGSGTGVCTGALSTPWHVIAIGSGTTAANNTQVALVAEHTGDLARGVATTKTWFNSTSPSGTNAARIQMERTFTLSSGGPQTVAESGLFNSTTNDSTDSMFARQAFGAITLNNGDSLTVRWTVNVGGTGTISAQTG